ncbi:BA14K family protein, partial [Bradyrhizobium brasilense]|nr:BA14K family protein [Bradyrhizobium brasilense]
MESKMINMKVLSTAAALALALPLAVAPTVSFAQSAA